ESPLRPFCLELRPEQCLRAMLPAARRRPPKQSFCGSLESSLQALFSYQRSRWNSASRASRISVPHTRSRSYADLPEVIHFYEIDQTSRVIDNRDGLSDVQFLCLSQCRIGCLHRLFKRDRWAILGQWRRWRGRLLRMNGGSQDQSGTRRHGDKWQMTHLFLPTRYVLLVIWLVMSRWPTLYTLTEPYSAAYLGLNDFRLVGERMLNSQWQRPLYSESV